MTHRWILAGIAALTALLALGCAALAVGHTGVEVPVLSRFGPGGSGAVVPAAIAFTVATAALLILVVGVLRRRSWSWALGLLTHALILLGAVVPFRGVGSAVAIIVSAACLALLMTRSARDALLVR